MREFYPLFQESIEVATQKIIDASRTLLRINSQNGEPKDEELNLIIKRHYEPHIETSQNIT